MQRAMAETVVDSSGHLDPARLEASPGLERSIVSLLPYAAGFAIAAFITVLRRPDALTNPQFFFEDGAIWYADAYQQGWLMALFIPYAGYFQVLPRLAASFSLLVPLHLAPLVMNLIGITVQCFPVCYLLSRRSKGWGTLKFRSALALSYVLLPNSSEVHVTITNGQWHLAILAVLVLVGDLPRTKSEQWFDRCVFLLCGLTGPFCILLMPFAWLRSRKETLAREYTVLLLTCSLLQLVPILCTAGILRAAKPTGACLPLFLRLVGGHLTLGLLWGESGLSRTAPLLPLALAAVFGLALIVYGLRVGSRPLRTTVSFALLLLASALKNPLVVGRPTWHVLTDAVALRYWYLPTLAFAWTLIWCCFYSPARIARVVCLITLLLSLAGFVKDFRLAPYPETGFQRIARSFESAPSETNVLVPVYPHYFDLIIRKR